MGAFCLGMLAALGLRVDDLEVWDRRRARGSRRPGAVGFLKCKPNDEVHEHPDQRNDPGQRQRQSKGQHGRWPSTGDL
jgi:hypothetical protein